MTEAHGAVTGSCKVSDEGLDINVSRETVDVFAIQGNNCEDFMGEIVAFGVRYANPKMVLEEKDMQIY